MSLLFKTLLDKNVDHFDEVNSLIVDLRGQIEEGAVSEPPPFTHSSQLMDWFFATSAEEKGVDEGVDEGVDKSVKSLDGEVNALLIRLLHQEDERETTKEIGEVKMCVIYEEHEPNVRVR
ncbi:hypothetical protein TrST_g4987, partial [Triparma strigata]